ncbi:hypothetical protein B0T26DRAFT_705662 [Lasiosphaeria miniovina]|uniref:Uncharacterized protein n=1 Tax=Lasiosphaeria miniovina TaxID=1954250 RepID=A0AA40AWA5_9PEZI|nr:uncharacterized protein B0T26DRAFT_705662 [Lasiosphaeria miniovina]KAK0723174.1 hypothetical protein B0T26DRAFT_705662 [Lasiosphaeria miniovina]
MKIRRRYFWPVFGSMLTLATAARCNWDTTALPALRAGQLANAVILAVKCGICAYIPTVFGDVLTVGEDALFRYAERNGSGCSAQEGRRDFSGDSRA